MTRPQHLMTLSDGSLIDCRRFDAEPLRVNFEKHHRYIDSAADLKATLRAGPYAWPGGYPLYFITASGDALSFDGVRKQWAMILWDMLAQSDARIVGVDTNWEDNDLECCITGERIPSAYGDDEQQEGTE